MKFTGIMPALVTPFAADGRTVDEAATRALVEYQLGLGADGFYILGSTGEGLLMSEEARRTMCEIVIDQVGKRKPVICHVAAMRFDEAVRLAKHAEAAGADAISAIPPIFFHYREADIFAYYKTLAESTHLPFIMYNHPAANGGLSADSVAKMFEVDQITGVKWTVNNYYEVIRLKEMTHGEMNIINGPDEMLISGLAAGCDAGIGTTYNVMLPQYLQIYRLFRAGKVDEARAVQEQVNRVVHAIIANEVIPATKAMCAMLGYPVGEASFPMRQMSEDDRAALAATLSAIGWPFA
ncbi:MAG: dihydrodipicolinate synthase family protein [Clostridia bacterium]|nr:dihydrodipicolinate synthase family protein [Clostridia bacterium]